MRRILFSLTMLKSRRFLIKKYSKEWFERFSALSKRYFNELLTKLPDIGESIFSFNYKFAPAYIAWYRALADTGVSGSEADETLWRMNEALFTAVPSPLLHTVGKAYLNGFRKKASAHAQRQSSGSLHPYDWRIEYRDVDANCFEIDITECAFKKLAVEYGTEGLLPGICRIDYLSANLMGNGFERTKTLGDGDDCCNCRYYVTGSCEWSPEKGFTDRK